MQGTVKYVLYSHYSAFEEEDFKAYEKHQVIESLRGIQHIESHFRGLKELLNAPGYEGNMVIFYSPGFEEFLEGIAHRTPEDKLSPEALETLLERSIKLKFADEFAKCIKSKIVVAQLQNRVRFITPIDLFVILGRVNNIFAENFRSFFVGPAKGIRYDTPKIVEAILRLRVIGNGVPVLRLDHDVIFRGDNKGIGDLGLFKAVACSVRAYQLRLAEPSVSTFLFSSSYNTRALLDPSLTKDRFEAWSRAFATRIHPVLLVNPQEIEKIFDLPENDQEKEWDNYVKFHLDETIARRFFNLKAEGLEADGMNGLALIGAHPLYAVISGALLCLSEGAILDLPPFSNFRTNVMWIDDHLKYSLHRAMSHFTSGETLNLEPGLSDARLDDVMITKARPAVKNLPVYALSSYLPTLLYGAIMDSWITTTPILKYRVSSLDEPGKQSWRYARERQADAPLPKAMLKALKKGHFSPDDESDLENELMTLAIQRIEVVRQLWAQLTKDGQETFASCWAKGNVKSCLPENCKSKLVPKGRMWEGIAPEMPLSQTIISLMDLNSFLMKAVEDLVKDAITYVKWTLEWPKFVQIVRSIEQGSFVGDLSWREGD